MNRKHYQLQSRAILPMSRKGTWSPDKSNFKLKNLDKQADGLAVGHTLNCKTDKNCISKKDILMLSQKQRIHDNENCHCYKSRKFF